mgnify:CR=1 FL=1
MSSRLQPVRLPERTLPRLLIATARRVPERVFLRLVGPAGTPSPRTLNFSHYLFEAIPYACLALGILLDRAWDGRHPLLARGYVVLVAALFLFFLPLLTALPVPTGAWGLGVWTWFRTWV